MHRAAGVSSLTLICHRDTWDAVDQFWGSHFFVLPSRVPNDRVTDRGGGMVEVVVSGPNLVMLLKLTKLTHGRFSSPERRALAKRVYEQVAKVIDAVDPDADPGQPIPPIVLDDKLGTPE